jgi:hypothetical protein
VDGGYYLIGMRHPHAELFKGIRWGTAEVLAVTLENAQRLKQKTFMLKRWYDVDGPASLSRLRVALGSRTNPAFGLWTKRCLESLNLA